MESLWNRIPVILFLRNNGLGLGLRVRKGVNGWEDAEDNKEYDNHNLLLFY